MLLNKGIGVVMLGERLKSLRSEMKLTQADFADKFEISRGTIAMWETNKRQPDNDTLSKLADYFDVTVDYLLGRTDFPDLAIPKEIENMQFAFHGGINIEGLSKEDIDTLKKMADFMRSNKN